MSTIEIEKKFAIPDGLEKKLKNVFPEIKSIGIIELNDIYYDRNDYILTTNDKWLRRRNNEFELKLPLNKEVIEKRATDQCQELEDERVIIKALNLDDNLSLEENIAK